MQEVRGGSGQVTPESVAIGDGPYGKPEVEAG